MLAKLDVFGVASIGALHIEVGFADGEGFGVDLLPEKMHLGMFIDLCDTVTCDGEHATGAAAGIIDGAHDVILVKDILILGQQEVNHQSE